MSIITRRALGAAIGLLAAPAWSQSPAWAPSRAITIIVPFGPGGSTDILTRLLAERMTQSLGRPVQVENRAGGNTIVGAEAAARAPPTGTRC
jgi:tripartite-type tricarboxylate transporter receptor subunit TctC